MKKRTRLYILVFCLMVGLSFELFKSLKPSGDLKRPKAIALADMNLTPFHMSKDAIEASADKARRNLHVKNVQIKKLTIEDAQFAKTHSFAEKKAVAKKDDKKKKEADKKKEEKKAENEKKAEETIVAQQKIEAQEIDADDIEQANLRNEDIVFAAAPAAATEEGAEQISVNEWVLAITQSNSDLAINEFIGQYQTGQLPATTFFAVIEELIFISNSYQLKSIEILAAHPASQSFELLALIVQKTDNQETKAIARKTIEDYRKITMIPFLNSAISATDSFITAGLAIEIATFVADQFFQNLNTTNTNQSTDPDADLEALALQQEKDINTFRQLSQTISTRIEKNDLGNEFLINAEPYLQGLLALLPDVVVATN